MSLAEHRTLVIERQLAASARHAFRFWSDAALKERWNACHPDWRVVEDAFDFRVGGAETKRWLTSDGSEQTFGARYFDIVPDRRIIYGFEMSFGGQRVSVSLATIELISEGATTRMKYTEQLSFLGGSDALSQRLSGTEWGFDRLVEVIAADGAVRH
ncbi:SRPBCC family protein [Aminobacter sp. HY435]|uniref:SRPBCC family protein n=1 Tax=Aminobacter sp. HY435 TaxID=2970917 RepID=UPI0022B9B23B|nr:SRPBCC family protein [Aminobacter sp. HY435]